MTKQRLIFRAVVGAALWVPFSGCNSSPVAQETSSNPRPAAEVAANPSAQKCETSKDCHGMLPHLCVSCGNGMTGGCSHWSCVENTCQIKSCDIPPAPKPSN